MTNRIFTTQADDPLAEMPEQIKKFMGLDRGFDHELYKNGAVVIHPDLSDRFDLECFLQKGYSLIRDLSVDEFMDLGQFDELDLPNPGSAGDQYPYPELESIVEPLGMVIARILELNLGQAQLIGIMPPTSGWEPTNCQWHNDSDEGFDCNVLVYLDDIDAGQGGILEVSGMDSIERVVPKKGLIVCINQDQRFQHRITPTEQQRRFFEFKFKTR